MCISSSWDIVATVLGDAGRVRAAAGTPTAAGRAARMTGRRRRRWRPASGSTCCRPPLSTCWARLPCCPSSLTLPMSCKCVGLGKYVLYDFNLYTMSNLVTLITLWV